MCPAWSTGGFKRGYIISIGGAALKILLKPGRLL